MEQTRDIGHVEGGVLLPVNIISTMKGYDGEAALRSAGVVFHEPLADYPQLCFTELPAGWRIIQHNGQGWGMYNLLNNKNRVRATMRHNYSYSGPISMRRQGIRATIKVACPFILSFRGTSEGELVARVRIRHGSEIKAMPPTHIERMGRYGKLKTEKIALMKRWLDEALPGWTREAKYWDYKKTE